MQRIILYTLVRSESAMLHEHFSLLYGVFERMRRLTLHEGCLATFRCCHHDGPMPLLNTGYKNSSINSGKSVRYDKGG